MQAERDRLAKELSEMRSVTPKPRNAPKHGEAQVKARSLRRRINVNAKVKAVRGGGGQVGGKVARKSPLRSPPRRKSKDRRNLNDLRALHDHSEAADSELANGGLAEGSSDETEPEEDQGMLGEFRGTQADFKPNSQRDTIEMLADEIESMGRQASRQKISSELRGPVGTGKYRHSQSDSLRSSLNESEGDYDLGNTREHREKSLSATSFGEEVYRAPRGTVQVFLCFVGQVDVLLS